jgi:hypothetical protein
MKSLDYEKIARDVNAILEKNFDFLEDVDYKYTLSRQITQSEAYTAIELLSKIYLIAHCVDCEACQKKYLKDKGELK